jgi:BirA family biotin operon repressor/biotin-[acetyl-CoA-carboxylase] ligase
MEFRIFAHGMVDSTSERAFASLAEGSASHGDVHVALGQTAGRGRRGANHGHGWVSPPDAGLYASVVLRPGKPLDAAALTMGAGLAVRRALGAVGLTGCELKWPNDLLVGGAKICGLLAETRGLDPAAPHCVVGIGVNVAQTAFPAELTSQRPVTSLALAGIHTTPRDLLEVLLPHFGREIERIGTAPEAVAEEYFAALHLLGRKVRVLAGEETLRGVLRGAGLRLGLELALEPASVRRVRLEHVRSLESDPGP